MTPWADPIVHDLDCWEDLEDHLGQSSRAVTIVVGQDGPVVTMDTSGLLGGALRVTDPRDRLRAQDRRRLHRLGLRPEPGTAERSWTWQADVPLLPTGTTTGELLQARLMAWTDVEDSCRTQFVSVLREGLRLQPAQLTLLPVEEDEHDDTWDDTWAGTWDEEWGDVR